MGETINYDGSIGNSSKLNKVIDTSTIMNNLPSFDDKLAKNSCNLPLLTEFYSALFPS
jgi:hypothetical protein